MLAKIRSFALVGILSLFDASAILAGQEKAAARVDGFGVPLQDAAIARIGFDGVMRHGYGGHSLAVSDDGKWAATAGDRADLRENSHEKQAIWIWDLARKKRVHEILVDGYVYLHHFTRDGGQILGAVGGKLVLWDITSGKLLWRGELKMWPVRVWLDPPGTHAFVLFHDQGIANHDFGSRLAKVDLATGKTIFDWAFATTRGSPGGKDEETRVVADLSADGTRLVAGIQDGDGPATIRDVRFYDVGEQKLLKRFGARPVPSVCDLHLAPDKERAIVSAWFSDDYVLLDSKTGDVRTIAGIPRYVLRWYDDKRLVIDGPDGGVLWHVEAGKERRIADTGPWSSRPAVFSRDLKTLVTNAGMLQVWDVETGRDRNPEWEPILPRHIRLGETTVHSNGRDVWDRVTWKRITPMRIDESKGEFLTTVADTIALLKDKEGRLAFVDIRTGNTLRHGSEMLGRNPVRPGYGEYVVVSSDQKRVCFGWDARVTRSLSVEKFQVFDVASGRLVSTGLGRVSSMSSDHAICEPEEYGGPSHLFDINKASRIRELKDLSHFVQFSADSKWLLEVDRKDEKAKAAIRIWNVAAWQPVRTFELESPAASIAWSPDGLVLAVVPSSGDQVQFWDPGIGRKVGVLHQPVASGIAFSPDGKTLATAGVNSITIWDYPKCVARSAAK